MFVYEQFFGIEEDEKAYEAPEDLASAATVETEALDVAADEVRAEGGETIEEETVSAAEDELSAESDEPTEGEEEIPPDEEDESVNEEEFEDEPLPEEDVFEDPEYEYEKKVNVFNNTKRLLEIVTQNKESFNLRFGKGLNPELTKEYRLIDKNFSDFIQVAGAVLSTKFASKPYNILMKYYVSLTKVYDIITRMTDNFVTKYNEEIEN